MRNRFIAALAALPFIAMALISPNVAQAAPNPGAAVSIKDSPASTLNISVQWWPNSNSGAYLDTVNIGATEGEAGSANIWSEPVQWRLAPNWCARQRTWQGPSPTGDYTSVSGWTSFTAPLASYPNGRWFRLPNADYNGFQGKLLFEVVVEYCS